MPSFAQIAAPLHALTREELMFHWSQEAEQAFCYLTALTSPPVLGYPEPDGPYIVDKQCRDWSSSNTAAERRRVSN